MPYSACNTARSVELAALVSPAFSALGVGNPLNGLPSPHVNSLPLAVPSPGKPANLVKAISPKRMRAEGTSPLKSPTVPTPTGEAPSAIIAC